MDYDFDAIIIGMGPGGKQVAGRLLDADKSVAVVERDKVGGECAYYGCIPSKVLVRPADIKAMAERSFGVSTPTLDWESTAAHRDMMIKNLDDSGQAQKFIDKGAELIRGVGRITGNHTVEVDGQQHTAEHIILATGTKALVPPIDGLADVEYWTNEEATTSSTVPSSLIVIGGGPIGLELAQAYASFGSVVTVIEGADRVLSREDDDVSEIITTHFSEQQITIHTGVTADSVAQDGAETTVSLSDGSTVAGERLLIAVGRRASTKDLGLETIGVELNRGFVPVDEHCKVADGVWAVGDCTGELMFTHGAAYQGRVVASTILGTPVTADYNGAPRTVFTDPEISAVGMTLQQAQDDGLDVATVDMDMTKALAKPWVDEESPFARLRLIADRSTGHLIGAWAAGPAASEWMHLPALVIRMQLPLSEVKWLPPQFPTYSEGVLGAIEQLDAKLSAAVAVGAAS